MRIASVSKNGHTFNLLFDTDSASQIHEMFTFEALASAFPEYAPHRHSYIVNMNFIHHQNFDIKSEILGGGDNKTVELYFYTNRSLSKQSLALDLLMAIKTAFHEISHIDAYDQKLELAIITEETLAYSIGLCALIKSPIFSKLSIDNLHREKTFKSIQNSVVRTSHEGREFAIQKFSALIGNKTFFSREDIKKTNKNELVQFCYPFQNTKI